jgi:hypothetical protein
MVAKACWWVRLHPEKWRKLKDFCGYLMEEGDLIQRGNVYELARRYGMDVRLASEFKPTTTCGACSRGTWSWSARCSCPPSGSARPPVDQVPLVEFWHDIVGEDEFVAGSLEEARRIYDIQRGAR